MKKKKILLALLVIFCVMAGMVANYIRDSLDYADNLKASVTPENDSVEDSNNIEGISNSVNILFLGIDKTEERESWLGTYRTDTIAIARINLDTKQIKILNIPRDTYTFIPIENKKDKINHAYAYGSFQGNAVKASIDAVSKFTGNKIDYYFLMDMEPIPSIVDEIGGVRLDVEIDMKDHGADLSKGLQTLNGKQAFDYIHWRYSAGGDIDRIKRQQKFMSTLLKQQRDSGKILETLDIVLKHKDSIQTDLSLKQMIGLAKFIKDVPEGGVSYLTLSGEAKMIEGISYWVPNEKETAELFTEYFK
jgi:LCP family protein required for cell wall assembly